MKRQAGALYGYQLCRHAVGVDVWLVPQIVYILTIEAIKVIAVCLNH